jgi:very-short-patch-repair endonuclease
MSAPQTTFARARRLRREMTLPEVLLWRALRGKALDGLRFRKQHPISEGVLDFYLPSARLAVEVDGQAHDRGGIPSRDARRDAWLAGRGIKVLRVPASEVLDQDGLDSVLRLIAEEARVRLGSACVLPSVRCAYTSPANGGGLGAACNTKSRLGPRFRPPAVLRNRGDNERGGGGVCLRPKADILKRPYALCLISRT